MKIGAVAQLGERYNGIVEVRGSIPLGSTIVNQGVFASCSTVFRCVPCAPVHSAGALCCVSRASQSPPGCYDYSAFMKPFMVSHEAKASNQPVLVVVLGYMPNPCPPCS